MTYNLTALSAGNETGLLTFIQGVNEVLMFNSFGNLLLLGIWGVLISSMLVTTQDLGRSIMASCFICFTLALSLSALGLVHPVLIFITLAGAAIGAAVSWKG